MTRTQVRATPRTLLSRHESTPGRRNSCNALSSISIGQDSNVTVCLSVWVRRQDNVAVCLLSAALSSLYNNRRMPRTADRAAFLCRGYGGGG